MAMVMSDLLRILEREVYMSELDNMKSSLVGKKAELQTQTAERERCMGMAEEIEAVYKRLKEDKELMSGYRDSVKSFSNETFDRFVGNLYSSSYKNHMDQLVSSYNQLIRNIDDNMDRLNTLRAQYENKAYQCDGIIGSLRSVINTLVHKIENWTN